MSLVGVHIHSSVNNILSEIKKYHKKKCTVVQLFVDPFYENKEIYDEFALYAKNNSIKIIVHASYSINCAQQWDLHSWWIKQFILEIQSAKKIGAYAVVVHLGKKLKLSTDEAINNMFTSLLHVHNETLKDAENVKILLETSTGQGTEMCYKIEDLAYFYRKFSGHKNTKINERFGICLDTCHMFAAGHDITSKEKVELFLDVVNELIGIKNVKLIHFNDSKKELGSNVDRHENIGNGFIGEKPLLLIAKFFIKLSVPLVLETPETYLDADINKLLKINY